MLRENWHIIYQGQGLFLVARGNTGIYFGHWLTFEHQMM